MPEIQAQLIPLDEQLPTASNVSARIDLLLSISFPLTIFLVQAAQLPATPSISSPPPMVELLLITTGWIHRCFSHLLAISYRMDNSFRCWAML